MIDELVAAEGEEVSQQYTELSTCCLKIAGGNNSSLTVFQILLKKTVRKESDVEL